MYAGVFGVLRSTSLVAFQATGRAVAVGVVVDDEAGGVISYRGRGVFFPYFF